MWVGWCFNPGNRKGGDKKCVTDQQCVCVCGGGGGGWVSLPQTFNLTGFFIALNIHVTGHIKSDKTVWCLISPIPHSPTQGKLSLLHKKWGSNKSVLKQGSGTRKNELPMGSRRKYTFRSNTPPPKKNDRSLTFNVFMLLINYFN